MRAILFDYNGVLVNDLDLHLQAYAEVLRRHRLPVNRGEIRQIMHLPPPEKARLLAGSDAALAAQVIREQREIYYRLAKQGCLFPDTRQVIELLAPRYRLAMLSNSTREAIGEVFPPDLLARFSVIITYEEITKPKPAPDSALLALKRLGVAKRDACCVGDAPTDMQMARAAGIFGIGVPTGYQSAAQLREAGAGALISRLGELPAAVAARFGHGAKESASSRRSRK